MSHDESLARPDTETLLRAISDLIDQYDPTASVYLDPAGRWLPNASGARDRISNEVWFRIWRATGQPGGWDTVRDLVIALVGEEYKWDLTCLIDRAIAGADGPYDALTAAMEAFYRLVEIEACKRVAGGYVAEWDTRGKEKARTFSERGKTLKAALAGVLTGADLERRLIALSGRLNRGESSLFDSICRVIAQEESVRYDLCLKVGKADPGGQTGSDLEALQADGLPWAKEISASQEGLLRPSMELITDPDLDVKTGIQYRAADVLGVLKDPRSTDTLLAALGMWAPEFTDLRAKIIYALGNLRIPKVLHHLIEILEGPDSVTVTDGTRAYPKSRHAEKREVVWALGKLESAALGALGALEPYAENADPGIRVHLAWTMGEIGRRQKSESGGVDARILVTLLKLMTGGDRRIVEEAAAALKGLETPDFMRTIYLQNLDAVPMSSLKPSSTGLYELSETILHLASLKRPVVMAVTGDSGTGKTYFCRAIANGFGDTGADEILYLMRDRSFDKTLDRILGIKWLSRHVEPVFYEDYPVPEEKDDPEAFFDEFIRANRSKKLIILDGWRDEAYFHPIMNKFYERGYLDVLVRFQATFSTRRLNLEEREASLDGVHTHLPLEERPALEETILYREGEVLIYDLDNSLGSRLTGDETLEVFERRKVDSWGDQIRIGRFGSSGTFETKEQTLAIREDTRPAHIGPLPAGALTEVAPQERAFTRSLNLRLDDLPNLLETITTGDLQVERIAFYNHGQLAAGGSGGEVALLTGFDDRMFVARVHASPVVALAVAGGRIYSADSAGVLNATCLTEKETAVIGRTPSPVRSMAAHRDGTVVTGHDDGTLRVWDTGRREILVLEGQGGTISAVAIDRNGGIYWGDSTGRLAVRRKEAKAARLLEGLDSQVTALAGYIDGRVVVGTGTVGAESCGPAGGGDIALIDTDSGRVEVLIIPGDPRVSAVTVYYDGRLLVGSRASGEVVGTLAAIDLRERSFVRLRGHGVETACCVTMGPRLITSGTDNAAVSTIKIWGTSTYVRMEHDKLRLMPEGIPRPPYYRALF
jgi:hypothetical protein